MSEVVARAHTVQISVKKVQQYEPYVRGTKFRANATKSGLETFEASGRGSSYDSNAFKVYFVDLKKIVLYSYMIRQR